MMIDGIAGINEDNKPYKDTEKFINVFSERKELDIQRLFNYAIPDGKKIKVRTALGFIEFDMSLSVDVHVLSRPYDCVINTSMDNSVVLSKDIEYACFTFMGRDFVIYRELGDKAFALAKVIQLCSGYSYKDFVSETKEFNISVLGDEPYWVNYHDGEWSIDGECGIDPIFAENVPEMLRNFRENYELISDSEVGIEITKKVILKEMA